MAEARVERRLAAILAADVAGYSRLMGVDEEGTLAALKKYRREIIDPKIAEHRGRIVKTTGDGALVEFASAVDAVRCAMEIQHAMAERNAAIPEDRRIEFRIGINVGDIIIDEGDIYGDGVNIAARVESLASPGSICISENGYQQIKGKLALDVTEMGEHQLKNIAQPVRTYSIRLNGTLTRPVLALPNKPSIAVLPFQNMSGDPEQEYFADGMVEEIITALSRMRSLFVIARNSSFTYKGRAVDVKQVGRELGVRYVLEGSVRKMANRVRVTIQLIDAISGAHVWAERYDRDLSDIFAVQDEISGAVTTAIAPAVASAEMSRALRKPPDNLDAWAAYQRGLWHMTSANADDNAFAEKLFQTAIDLDPNFAGGYKGLALAVANSASVYGTRSPGEAFPAAEAFARRAVALDPADAEARSRLGMTLWMRADYEGALAEVDQALAISPNLAYAHGIRGSTLVFSGVPEEGIAALETAIRLDPRDPNLVARINNLAFGLYLCRRYEKAIEVARRGIRSYPKHPMCYRWLAAALGQAGRIAEAKEALRQAIEIAPRSFDSMVRGELVSLRPEDHAHWLDGLRRAGWEG